MSNIAYLGIGILIGSGFGMSVMALLNIARKADRDCHNCPAPMSGEKDADSSPETQGLFCEKKDETT